MRKVRLVVFIVSFLLFHYPSLIKSTRLESKFISIIGEQMYEPRTWKLLRNWYKEGIGEKNLKKFCEGAHKAGLNDTETIETVSLNLRTLKFLDPNIEPMQTDVVKYGIDLKGRNPTKTKKYWWFTEGHKSDCVYYLVPVNAAKTEFGLLEYICDIKY